MTYSHVIVLFFKKGEAVWMTAKKNNSSFLHQSLPHLCFSGFSQYPPQHYKTSICHKRHAIHFSNTMKRQDDRKPPPRVPPTSSVPAGITEKEFWPTDNDIILGRGMHQVGHVGNARFYEMIDQYMEEYDAAPNKGAKTLVVRDIYEKLLNRGARFLGRNKEGNFYIVEPKIAKKKISHAIRYRKQSLIMDSGVTKDTLEGESISHEHNDEDSNIKSPPQSSLTLMDLEAQRQRQASSEGTTGRSTTATQPYVSIGWSPSDPASLQQYVAWTQHQEWSSQTTAMQRMPSVRQTQPEQSQERRSRSTSSQSSTTDEKG